MGRAQRQPPLCKNDALVKTNTRCCFRQILGLQCCLCKGGEGAVALCLCPLMVPINNTHVVTTRGIVYPSSSVFFGVFLAAGGGFFDLLKRILRGCLPCAQSPWAHKSAFLTSNSRG